jgi:hypothetical protein
LITASIDGIALVQLQEVTRSHFENLKNCLSPSDSAFSLDFRAPGYHEGKNRALGVATFLFDGKIEKTFSLNKKVLHVPIIIENNLYFYGMNRYKTKLIELE